MGRFAEGVLLGVVVGDWEAKAMVRSGRSCGLDLATLSMPSLVSRPLMWISLPNDSD